MKKLIIILSGIIYFILSCSNNDIDTITPENFQDTTGNDTANIVDTTTTDTTTVTDTTVVIDTLEIIPYDTTYNLGAGFRYSVYGPDYDPGAAYWDSVGKVMAINFEDATPECIWILGVIIGRSCKLNFPVEGDYELIYGSSTDHNEEIFNLFDQSGYRVWLQVEPGNASIDDLIEIVMSRYSHHPCITGFGVDVEWLETTTPIGRQVTDIEAKRWVNKVKEYDPRYRVFFKHWEVGKMPPTVREDIVFIDDSQMFSSLTQMVNEFKYWGNYFAPADVGFQYGYPADKTWWGDFENPPKHIGDNILENVPNAKSFFWVDFTIIEVFPPSN